MAGAEADNENNNSNKKAEENGENPSGRNYQRSSRSPSAESGAKPQLPTPQPAGYKNKKYVDNLRIAPAAAAARTYGSSNPVTPRNSNGGQHVQWNYVDQSPNSGPYFPPPPTPAAQQQHYAEMVQHAINIARMVPPTPTMAFPPLSSVSAYYQQQPLLTNPHNPGWQTPRPSNGSGSFFSLPSTGGSFGYPFSNPFNMASMSAGLPMISGMPITPGALITPYPPSGNFGFVGPPAMQDALRRQVAAALSKPPLQARWPTNGEDFSGGQPMLAVGISPKGDRIEPRRDGTSVAYVDVDTRELAAEVVGKKGKNIKSIEQNTNCKIQAPVHEDGSVSQLMNNTSSLAFTIIGPDEKVTRAAMVELRQRIDLVKSIQHDRSNRARPSHGQIVRHLAVPARLVSFIVGHQGQEINRVADRCGCYVLSPKEDRDAIFHIVGSEPNTRQCVQRICDFIWKREQQSLFSLLQTDTWRREFQELADHQKSPSECRKLCGYIHLGTGTELLGGIEMRAPARLPPNIHNTNVNDVNGLLPTTVMINHQDMRHTNLGSSIGSDDDEQASSGYSGTGDNHSEGEVSQPELFGTGSTTAMVQQNGGNGFGVPPTYVDGSTVTSPAGSAASSLSGSVLVGENGFDDGSPSSVRSGGIGGGGGSNQRVNSAKPTMLHTANGFAAGGPLNNGTPAGVGISPVRPSFQQPIAVSRQPSFENYAAETVSVGDSASPATSPTTPCYSTHQQKQQQYQHPYGRVAQNGGLDFGGGYRANQGYASNGGSSFNNMTNGVPPNYPAHSSAYARGGSTVIFGNGGQNNRMFRSQGPSN